MNRRQLMLGTATTMATLLAPAIMKASTPDTITQTISMSDALVVDATAIGYIPQFFTAEKVGGDLSGRSWYKVSFQKKDLQYIDDLNFEGWTRKLSSKTSFTIERETYRNIKCLTMKIYDDGQYIATIRKGVTTRWTLLKMDPIA
jgi:hypothetical protein